jgi:arylsulfatase A-like enzyme
VSPPNIVVVMADDLGFGDLGCCNFGATRTPAIDSMAADGTMLTQHYSASPICAPARAAFLTGRYPQRSGVIDTFSHRGSDRISLRERTLGDLLGEAGYVTGLVGKWHSGALGLDYHPNHRGFAEFVGFRGAVQDYWDWNLERSGVPFPADGRYLTDVLSDEAVRFVRRHRHERFFLTVAYTAPHGPFQAPADSIRSAGGGERPTVLETIVAMVERMDAGIATLLDELDRWRLLDDTLVLFTSDNGPWMRAGSIEETTVRYNLGLAGGKELVHEGGIRVPTIVRWPAGIASRGANHAVTHFCDWVPTLLAAADHRHLRRLPGDGVDLLPQLRGDAAELIPPRFWQWSRYEPTPFANAAARDGNWKLRYPAVPELFDILAADPVEERRLAADPHTYRPPARLELPTRTLVRQAAQLFDLSVDPGERFDVATRHPQRVARMEEQFADWYASVEAERQSLPEAR